MPDAGYFGLTYELLFEGDVAWTDITSLVDSRTTKVDIAGCSEGLKSVISKCSFEMRYNSTPSMTAHSTIVSKILTAKQAGENVLFRMGGIATFTGKVDLGSFSQKNGRIPGFLTVTCEDNSYLLDEVMDSSFEYPTTEDLDDEGYAVFDKTNLAQSVVMLRFLDAGYTIDQIDTGNSDSITEKVRRVVYDADDERTYREMLDTLLFEHCAVIYTTPEGKLSVRRLYRESPVSERSVEEFLVGDGIETGGGDYSYDGVKVVWSNLSKLDGAVVYNANITMKLDDEGNREGEEIQPQHYWPEDGDIEETWQEFNATFLDRAYQTKVSRLKNKDLSLISVKNAYYEVDKDAAILLANNPPEIEPTKARVLWWNSHSTDVKKLYGFTIVGDALFRSKLNESTYPTDARKLDEPYETEFVYTSEAAAKLANHLHRFRKYGDLHHRWSEIGVDTPLFQVVTVSAPDTLISSLGMVISQSISFPAPNKIKRSNSAIGITAFNSEPVKTRSIQLGGAPVNTGPAGSNGTRSVVQFILGTTDGPYTDAGNVVGTDSAILGTDLALVGVDGAQWMYEAPTPDAGEIVWRREGYYTPPETWPKVWNITPMTGASSFGITLHPSALTIPVSSRGVHYGGNITISAIFQNIPTTYEITWGITGASFVDAGTNQTKVVEVDTVTSDAVIITVSVLFGGVTYTDMVTLNKVADGKPAPVNLGGVTVVPTDVGGEPLVAGDYFLWAGTTTATYTKGEIYEWDGDSWEKSTNRNLVMTMFDDFADLANDVESTVIGNAVIKKLVAIEAFVENLTARNLKVGTGETTEVEFDAIECNGSSSYAETSAFAIAGADRTFEMWIKPEIIDSYTGLFIQNTNANNTSSNNIVGFQGYPGSSNEITLAIGSSSAYYITGKVALPTGVWTHLAGVIEGGVSAKVYLNGNLLINEAISISPSTGSLKVIMGRIMDKYIDGMCRDFRIWNTVRTQQQIQDNMLADLVGNESGLIALWKANEMTGTTLTDSVGSNDATATGISWVTDIGVIGGAGFKFMAVQDDGTGKSRFDVYYNGERVFEANPQNGKIYFGNNFWYDPATKSIHTPNDKTVINADGTIEAVDGVFSGEVIATSGSFTGTINAEQGVFKGSIDSSAFASLPSSSGTTDDIILTSSEAYQVNTMADYCQTTLTVNKYYACSVTIDSSVEYIRYSGSGTDVNIYFCNSSFIEVAVMRRMYGTWLSYDSYYKGSSLTVSVSYGAGDVFKFKNLPTSASGLASGQVWRDGTTLKIVP